MSEVLRLSGTKPGASLTVVSEFEQPHVCTIASLMLEATDSQQCVRVYLTGGELAQLVRNIEAAIHPSDFEDVDAAGLVEWHWRNDKKRFIDRYLERVHYRLLALGSTVSKAERAAIRDHCVKLYILIGDPGDGRLGPSGHY